ncbi:hypothetical protein [Arenibaculum pallidiluteum]|uniref:hypothetical protein n=1 Tax=Arenibaculum pallidiluteum TaxID=2812559 RepID=UPI001A97C699|nr:hypothetical protein [Arenibaculum pallidiluteum]
MEEERQLPSGGDKPAEKPGHADRSNESNDPEAIRVIENADQLPEGDRRTEKSGDWWQKDPDANRSNINHPNMEPDNLKSNDL